MQKIYPLLMVKVSSVAQKSQHLRPQQYLPSRCGGGFPNSKKNKFWAQLFQQDMRMKGE